MKYFKKNPYFYIVFLERLTQSHLYSCFSLLKLGRHMRSAQHLLCKPNSLKVKRGGRGFSIQTS